MSLGEFARTTKHETATVTVLNTEEESPLYQLLVGLFDEDVITVQQTTTMEGKIPSEAVLVEKAGGAAGFAVSSLEAIRNELLLVNSDLYVTGARELDDVETPEVITSLDELPFTVRGYPADPREKLLLIEMSRHIEALAWQAGEGHLKTGFQYLSRLDDERGTRRVYERLGQQTDVVTHIYGVPDARPSLPGVRIHGEEAPEIEQSWFVVYQSAHHPHEAAALMAIETEPRTWEGCWTYDPDRVATILGYLDTHY